MQVTLRINDHRYRQRLARGKPKLRFFRSQRNWIIHSCPPREPANLRSGFRWVGHAYHLKLPAISPLILDQIRNFLATWWTPRRPEIKQHNLALIIFQAEDLTI